MEPATVTVLTLEYSNNLSCGPLNGFGLVTANIAASVTATIDDLQFMLRRQRVNTPQARTGASSKTYSAASVSAVNLVERATQWDLLFYAERRLAAAVGLHGANPTQEAVASLRRVLGNFVADGGPTPQVGPTPSGSVEVQWLSNGTLVSALFDESGEYNLYAVDASDSVLFDDDVEYGLEPSVETQQAMTLLLEEMSASVKARPASWY